MTHNDRYLHPIDLQPSLILFITQAFREQRAGWVITLTMAWGRAMGQQDTLRKPPICHNDMSQGYVTLDD